MSDEPKFLTTLEKIQEDHKRNVAKMIPGERDRTFKSRGSMPDMPPDLMTSLLQQIFDSVQRIEAFIRTNYPMKETIYDAQASKSYDEPLFIQKEEITGLIERPIMRP